ncbi:MAG: GMC family oxidoreductase, partial [Verrucomicrobiae bacterium]|nr:GMC family oxidoreductase [Verrucomicrobiae bacterium]
QNLNQKTRRKDYLRGFVLYGHGSRGRRNGDPQAFGGAYKDSLTTPGAWTFGFTAFGETLPNYENRVTLDYERLDPFGLPQLVLDVQFGENEHNMRKEMSCASAEILETAGFRNVETYNRHSEPGLSIHEMGAARMGNNPKTSVLDRWSRMHEIPNVFATDGSGMCSNGWGNPSLTYMALTARACDFAVGEMKKRNL